ncbi:MAG TPA: sigma-70 family RNA polymerase sigma factor [Ignavibacteriales bacterium]|nr:sigma-70 family RNA polymerase sigma factor [Ignavibacteriales bacterium]
MSPARSGILEEILIEKAKNGDDKAFAVLMKQYRLRLGSYIFKSIGDRIAAEDVLQETLIKVWKGLGGYKSGTKFSSWLFSIAHNAAVDHIRKNIKAGMPEEFDDEKYFKQVDDPFKQLTAEETKKIVNEAVNKLPEKQRQVFLLRAEADMSFKEIAELTGEPLNTVLSHMRYAVIKLRNSVRLNDA